MEKIYRYRPRGLPIQSKVIEIQSEPIARRQQKTEDMQCEFDLGAENVKGGKKRALPEQSDSVSDFLAVTTQDRGTMYTMRGIRSARCRVHDDFDHSDQSHPPAALPTSTP